MTGSVRGVTTVRAKGKRGRVHLVRQEWGTAGAGLLRVTAACGRPVEGQPDNDLGAVDCVQCTHTAAYALATGRPWPITRKE